MNYTEIIRSSAFGELKKADFSDERFYDELIEEYCDKKGTAWVSVSEKILTAASEFGTDAKRLAKEFLTEAKKELMEAKKAKTIKSLPAVMSEQAVMREIDASDNPLGLSEPELARAVCLNYTFDADGIYEMTQGGGRKRFCHTPMMITRQYENAENGNIFYNLAYLVVRNGNSEVRNKIVPAATISDSNKIKELSNVGILANSNNAKSLVDYLTECVANGLKNGMETGDSTSRFGWLENGKFAPYDDSVMFDAEDRFSQLYRAVQSVQGDPDEYLNHMREVRAIGRLEINVQIAGAMASVMMGKYIKSMPFILHIFGETDSGKTMGMRFAMSQIGDPREGALIGDYMGTKAGIEARAGCLHNLPIALDDISKMSLDMRKSIEDLVYKLTGVQGRKLGQMNGGNRDVKQWESVVLSTGEERISNYCSQAGGLNRVFEITAGSGLAFDKPEREIRWLENNHGHVIRPFIETLRNLGEERISELYGKNKELINANLTEKVLAKQLQPLAVLLTADEVLTDCIYKDGIYLRDRLAELIGMLKTEDQISDGARAYEALKDIIAANPKRWYMDVPESEEAQGEQWGWKPNENYICITGTALRQVLAKEGLNSKKFIAWAIKKGLTETDKNGNAPVQHMRQTPHGPEQKRAWRIMLTKDEPTPGAFRAQVVDEEIPFK